MTHDELRELIARAACVGDDMQSPDDLIGFNPRPLWHGYLPNADAILSALSTAGLAIVPVEVINKTADYLNRLEMAMVKHALDVEITGCAPPSLVAEQLMEAAAMLAASPFTKETGR